MSRIIIILLALSLVFGIQLQSQNTVGLVSYKPWENSYDGYNLIYPQNQPTVYLMDNCGRIINQWEDEDVYKSNNTAYLTQEGLLLKTKKIGSVNIPIWSTDGENHVEARDWDNNIVWQYSQLDSQSRLHHDIEPTDYGTVFMIAWDHHSLDEAMLHGRDSSFLGQETFSPDKIIEYDPRIDSIIWEWRAWDHLVQDRDSSLANYGQISAHPERININYENNQNRADWMHVNAIDYNAELDQIMINVPTFNEIWIIDHSTTTTEAASSEGGHSGRGGDLLWRWGNPLAYDKGTEEDQKLFFQHDALWAIDHLDINDNMDYGNISVFNNNISNTHSSIGLIGPLYDSISNQYPLNPDGTFAPEDFYFKWQHPDSTKVRSTNLSSVQVLPNDNLLVCSGRGGYSLEINDDDEIVWEYITPFRNGNVVSQGTELANGANSTFRIRRYPLDYKGLENFVLDPTEYIELDPNEDFCQRALSLDDIDLHQFNIYPNPVSKDLSVSSEESIESLFIFDVFGREIIKEYPTYATKEMDVDLRVLEAGIYYLQINKLEMEVLVKVDSF